MNLNEQQAQLLGMIQSLDKKSCLYLINLLSDRALQLEMRGSKPAIVVPQNDITI